MFLNFSKITILKIVTFYFADNAENDGVEFSPVGLLKNISRESWDHIKLQ